jgi:large subunit ribosomal protein L39e
MARNKPAPLKRRLTKAARRAKRAPIWVIMKTRGRIRSSAKQRSWRRQRIKP